MLLFVYTTTHTTFEIFTCRYFKLSWNTTALSQSNCINFSCSSITEILRCLAYTILQRFYNSWLILFYRDLTMPCLYHFTEILQCPACTILQGLRLIPCEISQVNPGISQEFPRIIPGTSK